MRLQGPLSANGTGRVEIFYNGEWGTVCDDYWDMSDAQVVCRELGYKYAVKALRGSSVPDGQGKIWLDNVLCRGNEQNLSSCSHNGWGNHDCGHYDDAGVQCSSIGNNITRFIPDVHITIKRTQAVEVFAGRPHYSSQWRIQRKTKDNIAAQFKNQNNFITMLT